MAHVHVFGTVAPAAAGIIQYDLLSKPSSWIKKFHSTPLQPRRYILLCNRVRHTHLPSSNHLHSF